MNAREALVETEPCYLCDSTRFHARKGVVRDDASLRVIECAQCGLVTLTSRDHIRDAHYEKSKMHGDVPPPVEAWLRESEADDERRFETLKAALVNRRVLDFGSGAGGFVRKAQVVTREIAAVEPERRVREHWKDAIAIHGSLDEAGDGYDIITAFHVVEHLTDPRATLRQLGARLASHGRLIVEVPSASDALLSLYDCDAFQRFTYWSQHLFLFSVSTMTELIKQAGLKVVAVQQYQRYSLANHVHWLSRGLPGGHQVWAFLDRPELTAAYTASLASAGICDTIIAHIGK